MMSAKWILPVNLTAWLEALSAVLHRRSAWRLNILFLGILMAKGLRTVTSWFRAVGITQTYKPFYYFVGSLARKTRPVATILLRQAVQVVAANEKRLCIAIDDTPTKRYGPEVEGAGIHHNPTPGPGKSKFVYGHVWVTLSLISRHRLWGTIGLPLLAKMYVRMKNLAGIPPYYRIRFQTKLQQAADLVRWAADISNGLKKALWVVADGGYTKASFLKPVIGTGAVVITRLRKDAALRSLPKPVKKCRHTRGRPRKYGEERIDLRRKAMESDGWTDLTVTLYGEETMKHVKQFQATYRPAGGVVTVVMVREADDSWRAWLCSDPSASAREILELVADRFAIEQNYHDLKAVEGIGQQQLRNYWANIGAFHLNMWVHTLVELWAWKEPASVLVDRRNSPWDDEDRRPSHADRRAALQREILQQTFFETFNHDRKSRKIIRQFESLLKQAI